MSFISAEGAPGDAETNLALLLRVKRSLHRCGYRVIRALVVDVNRSTVSVHGQVPSFFLRQIAVECVKRQQGVTQIVDRIEVVYPMDDPPNKAHLADDRKNSSLAPEYQGDQQALTRKTQDALLSQFLVCPRWRRHEERIRPR